MSVSVIITPAKLQLAADNEDDQSESLSFESSSNINHSALDDSESEPDEDALFHGKMNEWTNLYKPRGDSSVAQNKDLGTCGVASAISSNAELRRSSENNKHKIGPLGSSVVET